MPEYNPEELDPMWDDSHIDRSVGDDAAGELGDFLGLLVLIAVLVLLVMFA